MPVSKIMHKGKEIIFIDHQGCSEREMIENLAKAEAIIFADNKPHLQYINGHNAYATPAFMKAANEFGKKTRALMPKGAYVGLTGAKKILFNAYNLLLGGKLKGCNTEQEALDYLAAD